MNTLSSPALRAVCAAIVSAFLLSATSIAQTPQTASSSRAVTIYRSGRIYTNDPASPWAEAMLVRGEEILAVGDDAEVTGLADKGAQVVDLEKHFVMPGFNDAHVHIGGAGQDWLAVRLNGAQSVTELQKRLAKGVAQHKEGEWITGSGWDHTFWPEKKFPNRQQLDVVSPKNPVILTHISGHVAIANSLALQLSGVTKSTPNPSGGEIEKDEQGEPTGMLKAGAAMHLVESKIPSPTPEQRRRGIELALADLAKNGVTSAQDNSAWEDFLTYRGIKNDGSRTVRITGGPPLAGHLGKLDQMRRDGGTTDSWLRTGALKMVTDGALGSRTAAMLAPYSDDPSTSGIMTMESQRLRELAIQRDKAGFQLAFHAIGDRANRVALDVFEAVARVNGSRGRRNRIEHAQVVAPEDFARFAKLNVIASMQPSHETTDMRWAEQRLGPERAKGAYAWASLQKARTRLAFGTDYPVEVISPMRGLHACVTRELDDGGPPGGWQPQEKIALEDCIRAYTSGSAYAEFEEEKKGELKPGEFADFVLLSDDLMKIPAAQYTKTRVLLTVVGGRTAYQKK